MKRVLRKIENKIRIIAALVMVGMLMVGICVPAYATQDNEAPVFDFDSLTLSKTVFDNPYESPHISIKISDASEIEVASLAYAINGKINAVNVMLEYNPTSGYYEGTVLYENYDEEAESKIGYYGDYVLVGVYAVDIYGNTTNMYDLNIPAGNFSVVYNGPKDETAPVIDYENIIVSGDVAVGERGSISVPIADDSELYQVYARYTHKNSGSVSKHIGLQKNANGKYEAPLYFEEYEQAPQGCYQLAYIYAVDAFFNEIYLYNTANNHFNEGDNTIFNRVLRDLQNLDFVYGTDAGEVETGVTIESISVSNRFYNKGSVEKITIVFDSKTEINQVSFMYYLNELQQFSTGMEKIGPNTFVGTMPLYIYGNWRLALVEISDVYGNTIKLNDKRDLDFVDGVRTDLSAGDCHVGILDEATGVCISDNEMDDTTVLTVEQQALEGEMYEEMLGEGCTGVAMYDIRVEGNIGDVTSVAFEAPAGVADGEEVTIVHRQHDGTDEVFEVLVEDGLVVIETDEFSPFLVKMEGSWTPPPTDVEDEADPEPGTEGEGQPGDSSDQESEDETETPSDTENEEEVQKPSGPEKEEEPTGSLIPDEDERSGLKPIVIIAICLAVIAVGAGVFVILQKKCKTGNHNKDSVQ